MDAVDVYLVEASADSLACTQRGLSFTFIFYGGETIVASLL